MSLHGTLETFALPDVLALLAATKKSGELRVVGGKTDGRVWFDAGAVVGSEVGRTVSFVDAVFELLRLDTGKFSFDAEKSAPSPDQPAAIEPLLAEAQARLAEWKAIEAVVPSLEHAVRLVAEVRDPHVMVTGEQWRALVGVAAAPSVTGVVERLGIGEFDTCRTLKGLVDAGLVTVEEPTAPAPEAPKVEAPKVEAPKVEAPKVEAPKVEAPKVEALQAPKESDKKPKIQALTSTPAASAAALEEAVPAEPPTAGEADELVRQVAALEAEVPAPAEAAEASEADTAEAAPVPPEANSATEGDEPINRGLLLKFLSSVRT